MLKKLREKCLEKGFDLCDAIHTHWYNELIENEGHVARGTLKKISEPATLSEGSLKFNAVLIGNSKIIWPKFISWLSSQYTSNKTEVNEDEVLDKILTNNPFDTFVTDSLTEALRSCFLDLTHEGNETLSQISSYEIHWSNCVHDNVSLDDVIIGKESYHKNSDEYHCSIEDKSSSFLLSMQRAAKVTGKYWHDEEGTKLCVHPEFGTWKSFRAVVIFHSKKSSDKKTLVPEAPAFCLCPVSEEEIEKAKEIMQYALEISGDNKGYGGSLCKYLHHSVSRGSDWSKVSPAMRPWIQLRDCISIGRSKHKYCDNQLLYHYTKDPEILKKELKLLVDKL